MKNLFQNLGNPLLGMLAALITSGIVIGSFVLAFAEGGVQLAQAPGATSTPELLASPTALPVQFTEMPVVTTAPPAGTPAGNPTPGPTGATPAAPDLTPTATETLPPPPVDCPPPPGWVAYAVRPGDTLNRLAETYNTTPEVLIQGNCLIASQLVPDSILYVPAAPPTLQPTNTPTPAVTTIPCGPPSGWVRYTVQPGDTLFELSLAFGVSVNQLQVANCLGSSTLIQAGQQVYVPFIPSPVPTNTLQPTKKPVPTETPAPPSATPVPPTETPKPTKVPTDTPVPTEEPTEPPANTPVPTTPTSAPADISSTPAGTPDVKPAAVTSDQAAAPAELRFAGSGISAGTRRAP